MRGRGECGKREAERPVTKNLEWQSCRTAGIAEWQVSPGTANCRISGTAELQNLQKLQK